MALKEGTELREEMIFDIEKKIGTGNYGNVFKATQKGIGRPVAIKELKDASTSELKKETWIQGRLIHPNIVTVFLFDEVRGYLVMEYVESSLESKIKNLGGKIPMIEEWKVVEIAQSALEALAYAHDRECKFHGDIKPGNILVTADWRVKLSDFGVARTLYGPPSEMPGSETWASPETLRAWDGKRIWAGDEKSDLFSLGVILYLLVTGNHPFVDPSGLRKTKDLVVDPDFVPPSPKTGNQLLARIIKKMLVKETRHRYQSAQEALLDLNQPVQEPEDNATRMRSPVTITTHSGKPAGAKASRAAESPEDLISRAFDLNSVWEFEQAEELCTEALGRNPDSVSGYQTRGFARSNLGKHKEAIADFSAAIEKTPVTYSVKLGQLHYQRGYTKMLRGDMAGACDDVQKAMIYDPVNPKYQYLRSKVCKDG